MLFFNELVKKITWDFFWHCLCTEKVCQNFMEKNMAEEYNENIVKVLRLSREMMLLADTGDENRQDKSCGVLYGTLRDAAYKIRTMAEEERLLHQKNGIWDQDEGITQIDSNTSI